MKHKVYSFQIADNIDVKTFKTVFKEELLFNDSEELFYRTAENEFIYVFRFGVVSLYKYNKDIETFFELIKPYCKNIFDVRLSDDIEIETGKSYFRMLYNKIELPAPDSNSIRFIMLNLSQSVALDHYSQVTNILLNDTNRHTLILEQKGRLDISGKNLKKYIGRTLNIKNRISENLYIFDSPDETWENEELNKMDADLKKNFDLQVRFRTIQDALASVKENLELFKDILQYRNSTQLEWVIIILILVEVINLFVEKIFK